MGRDPLDHSASTETRGGRSGDAGSVESARQKRLAEVFEHFSTPVPPTRSQRAGGHGKDARLMSRKQLLEVFDPPICVLFSLPQLACPHPS